ncbi:MAG: hypothetical protein K9M99_02420 [Candidatus Cloacimonetes bacterium]|nr:hypothetical protein [Candidatus Cloacimonadota bacterium]
MCRSVPGEKRYRCGEFNFEVVKLLELSGLWHGGGFMRLAPHTLTRLMYSKGIGNIWLEYLDVGDGV